MERKGSTAACLIHAFFVLFLCRLCAFLVLLWCGMCAFFVPFSCLFFRIFGIKCDFPAIYFGFFNRVFDGFKCRSAACKERETAIQGLEMVVCGWQSSPAPPPVSFFGVLRSHKKEGSGGYARWQPPFPYNPIRVHSWEDSAGNSAISASRSIIASSFESVIPRSICRDPSA